MGSSRDLSRMAAKQVGLFVLSASILLTAAATSSADPSGSVPVVPGAIEDRGGNVSKPNGIIQPTLQAGDADQNLEFDQYDLVQVLQAGKYLTGPGATWAEGDWDGAPGGSPGSPPPGDGEFNQADLIEAYIAGFYLDGPYAAGGVPAPLPPPILGGGVFGDEQTSLVYDPITGVISVDPPVSQGLTSLNVLSDSGIFTGGPPQNLDGSFDNATATNLFKATFGSSFGFLSFGNVASAGLGDASAIADLRVNGSLAGGGGLGAVDLIYVFQPGDADRNLEFDQYDLIQVLQAGKYEQGPGATWEEGDWNGDGEFNSGDLIEAFVAGFYLDGPYAAGGVPAPLPPPILPGGVEGDGQTSVIYDANTGEVSVDSPPGGGPDSINLVSASGIFTGDPSQNLDGLFDNATDAYVFKATFGVSFGSLSFGNVASAGLSEAAVVADLRVNGSLPGGGGLGDVDLVYFPHIPPTPLPEDINEDGHVDHLDLIRLQHKWHQGWRD